MSYSFSVQAKTGGSEVDFADYGLTVLDFSLPWEGEPFTETVNLPGRAGGYTYTNEAKPATLTLDVIVSHATSATLQANILTIAEKLPPLDTLQIHVDGVGYYWLGKRISGIGAGLFAAGLTAVEFQIVFAVDDPTPEAAGT